jgi:hypothetical protein
MNHQGLNPLGKSPHNLIFFGNTITDTPRTSFTNLLVISQSNQVENQD